MIYSKSSTNRKTHAGSFTSPPTYLTLPTSSVLALSAETTQGPQHKKTQMPAKKTFIFSNALLTWFDQHGRKSLPWQHPKAPYRVWLSEVMLQQTQVDTVIPYFERFVATYPSIEQLAAAPQDDVLHLWTGLGYYARARNLHKCAQQVVNEYNGIFPQDIEQLNALPGIGRSTACAIASIAFGLSHAILDGNVKRVLARFHGVDGWPGSPKVEKQLWQHADEHMPEKRCDDYSQAIMDLGATLCKRSKPQCTLCPMADHCAALAEDRVAELPHKKPKKVSPTKTTVMLMAQDQQGRILLEQRPQQGIWGGLWSFIEFDEVDDAVSHSATLGPKEHQETWSVVTHVFSHYKLQITPLSVSVQAKPQTMEGNRRWVTTDEALALGLAAPVKKLIQQIQTIADSLI